MDTIRRMLKQRGASLLENIIYLAFAGLAIALLFLWVRGDFLGALQQRLMNWLQGNPY